MLEGPGLLLAIFLAIVFIVVASSVFKLHAFVSLLLATIGLGLGVGMPPARLLEAMGEGFGGLLGYIGLIVVLGSIIGVILERSGGALRIADVVLRLLGQRRPALGMTLIGAAVSVPVFCDSGFIILSGLNKALSARSGVSRATLSLGLASGLYTTHTLIPPTPGPVAAAGQLGVADFLGLVMLLGLAVSIPTLFVAYTFARWVGPRLPAQEIAPAEMEAPTLPSAAKALAPLLIPIVLIALGSIVKTMGWEGRWVAIALFLGHPVMALLLGVIFALPLLPAWDKERLSGWIGQGVHLAGPILVITGMGGAFGATLKATPLAGLVESWVAGGRFGGAALIVITFFIAALLKTAQGSSTSALVITSSMLAPLAPAMGFDTPMALALLVLVIGGGAMTVSHANDSYFWVVSQFSDIEMKDAFRSFTVITALQGLSVLLSVLFLYYLLV